MARLWIPSLLRDLTGGVESVKVDGHTVEECLDKLDALHPGMRDRLCKDGDLIPALNIAVDGKINRRRLKAHINHDSVIHFVPAIAGG